MVSSTHNFKDLTGKQYGELLVLKRCEDYISPKGDRRVKWECICSCGKISQVLSNQLLRGRTKSCGCTKSQRIIKSKTKYNKGVTKSKEYMIWVAIKRRCYNPRNKSYSRYGGRGITMQEEWINNFNEFLSYVGKKPGDGYSLDRINNNGNYEEGNVRWADNKTQRNNQGKVLSSKNKFKFVNLHKSSGKYVGRFTNEGVRHSTGLIEDEKTCAIITYKLYREVKGFWPPYCEDSLVELGLLDSEDTENV
jgi:hypothetical protein